MSAIEYVSQHPAIALGVGVVHITAAKLMTFVAIPQIAMQLFQLGAWSTTIAVGLITIYGSYKKWKK